MGLGVYLQAELPRRGWLKRPAPAENFWAELQGTVSGFLDSQPEPLREWSCVSRSEYGISLTLCPLEENVEFFLENGRVMCSARTSTAGPGYHAYLVKLLDHLKTEIALCFVSDGDEHQDETGYFESRDFITLQSEMAHWLRSLARILLEKIVQEDPEQRGALLLGFPLGSAPTTDAFAASCMGEWSREWFERIVEASGDELAELAREYFPWWDEGLSAWALKNLAIARCWMDIAWCSPKDEDERKLYESVLECFAAARRLGGPILRLPDLEIAELRRLLEEPYEAKRPSPARLGYRRRSMRRSLPGDWSVELPGYYHEDLEDDGQTQVYYFGARTIRGSSLSFKAEKTPREILESSADSDEQPLSLRDTHLAGVYRIWWDDDDHCFTLRARVAKRNAECIVTVCFQTESDRTWAESVAQSIFAPSSENAEPD